jgi:hypothetical protein
VQTAQIPTAQEFTSTVGWSRPRTVSLVLEALNEKNLMKQASSEANSSTKGETDPEPS